MALKTDYKDAMYDGARRYRISQNADGTSGIADETAYTQKGDPFGANDINATNEAVNRLNHTTPVRLNAADWTGTAAPFVQTVSVPGVTEDMDVVMVSALSDGASAATQAAYTKAYAIISTGTGKTGDGTVTFKVYKKPAVDIIIGLRGV